MNCSGFMPKIALAGYTVVEDNSLLAMSLETKRLSETVFQTLSSDNSGKKISLVTDYIPPFSINWSQPFTKPTRFKNQSGNCFSFANWILTAEPLVVPLGEVYCSVCIFACVKCKGRFACVDICVYKLHITVSGPLTVFVCLCVCVCITESLLKTSRLMGAHLPVVRILMRWYPDFLAVWYSRNGHLFCFNCLCE